jgi:hypothetical protein
MPKCASCLFAPKPKRTQPLIPTRNPARKTGFFCKLPLMRCGRPPLTWRSVPSAAIPPPRPRFAQGGPAGPCLITGPQQRTRAVARPASPLDGGGGVGVLGSTASHPPRGFPAPRATTHSLLVVVRQRVVSHSPVADEEYLVAKRTSECRIVANPILILAQLAGVKVSDRHRSASSVPQVERTIIGRGEEPFLGAGGQSGETGRSDPPKSKPKQS